MTDNSKTIEGFEKQGESAIRKWLSEHVEENSDRVHYRLAQQWISTKESERRDAMEAKTLSIARCANKIAISAIIIATICAAISTFITVKYGK